MLLRKKRKSFGRCDQWRQCLPPAQIDKPDRTQEMDITRDSWAAGNQWCRQFSARLITADRLIQAIAPDMVDFDALIV